MGILFCSKYEPFYYCADFFIGRGEVRHRYGALARLMRAMSGGVGGQMSYLFVTEKPWCGKYLRYITFQAEVYPRQNAENAVRRNWTDDMGQNSVDRCVVKRLNANGMFLKCWNMLYQFSFQRFRHEIYRSIFNKFNIYAKSSTQNIIKMRKTASKWYYWT